MKSIRLRMADGGWRMGTTALSFVILTLSAAGQTRSAVMVTNSTGKLVDTNFFTANSNLLNRAVGPVAGGSGSFDPAGFNTNGSGQVSSQPTMQTVTNIFAAKTNAFLAGPWVTNVTQIGFVTNGGAGSGGGTTNAGTNTLLSTARVINNGTYVLNGAMFGSGSISIGSLTSTGAGTIDGSLSVLGSSSFDNGQGSTDGSGNFAAKKFSASGTPGFSGDMSGATGVPAGQLSGTVPAVNLGSGAANGGSALYGDQTFKANTNATPGTNVVIAGGAVSVGAAVWTNFDVNNRNVNGALSVAGQVNVSNNVNVTSNLTIAGAGLAGNQFSSGSQFGTGLGDYVRPFDNYNYGFGSIWGMSTPNGASATAAGSSGLETPPAVSNPNNTVVAPANGMPKGLLITNALGTGAYIGSGVLNAVNYNVMDTNSQVWSFLVGYGGTISSNNLWIGVSTNTSQSATGFVNGTNNGHSFGFSYTTDQAAGNNDLFWCAFSNDGTTATNRVSSGLTPATGTNGWLFTMVKTGSNIVYYIATNAISPGVCFATNHYLPASAAPAGWLVSDWSADNTKYGQVIFYEAYHQMTVGR